jgi:CheY-like chemotaxis protein
VISDPPPSLAGPLVNILEENRNVPIIAITSLTGPEESQYYYSIGMNAVVSKPFHHSLRKLLELIQGYLSPDQD